MQTVITGCGWVTPRAAGDISTVLHAYSKHGGHERPKFRYEPIGPDVFAPYTNLPGEAAKEDAVRLAAVALEIAWKQAGLNAESYTSDCKGLMLGCALAGVSGMIDFANDVRTQSARFVSPIRFPQTVGNYICGALARGYDFRGPASTIACGSASSLECIREGCALLTSGLADVVVAGGSELLSPEIVEGLNLPDVRFADGACLFVLERESSANGRGATVLATVAMRDLPVSGPDSPGKEVVSTAGCFHPRAISIEQWTGRTLGADGAFALAAAIGSTMRQVVPCHGMKPPDEIGEADFAVSAGKSMRRNLLVRASDAANRIHQFHFIGS